MSHALGRLKSNDGACQLTSSTLLESKTSFDAVLFWPRQCLGTEQFRPLKLHAVCLGTEQFRPYLVTRLGGPSHGKQLHIHVSQAEWTPFFVYKGSSLCSIGRFSSIFVLKFLCVTMASTSRGGSSEPRRLFSLDQVLDQLSGDENEVRNFGSDEG